MSLPATQKPSLLHVLQAAGKRVDGLSWDSQGNFIFRATRVSGPWTDAQKQAVIDASGAQGPNRPKTLPEIVGLITTFRDRRLANGYQDATTGKQYQCDPGSVSRWNAMAVQAYIDITSGQSTGLTFNIIAADNTVIVLTAQDTYNLFSLRVAPWVQQTIFYARQLKDQTLQGNPPADITTGWP